MAKVEKASPVIFWAFASAAASLMHDLSVLRAPSAAAD
jgi:hypothetical protein